MTKPNTLFFSCKRWSFYYCLYFAAIIIKLYVIITGLRWKLDDTKLGIAELSTAALTLENETTKIT